MQLMVCTQDPYTLRSKSRLITFLVQQGLMNKLRGILHNTITRVRNKDAADSGKTQNSVSKAEKRPPYLPKNYLLYIPKSKDREHFTLVGSEHWTLILHENKDEEFLDLYLRNTARDQDDSQKDDAEDNPVKPINELHGVEFTEQLDGPISQDDRKNSSLNQAQATSCSTSPETHTPLQTERSGVIVGSTDTDPPPLNRTSIKFAIPHGPRIPSDDGTRDDMYKPFDAHIYVPKILPEESLTANVPPFLEWPILDQFGENVIKTSGFSPEDIVSRFLEDVIRQCSIEFFGNADDIATTLEVPKIKSAELTRALQASKAYEIARSQSSSHGGEAQVETTTSDSSNGKMEARMMLIQKCKHLLEMFVPMNDSTKVSEAVELYWGAVFFLRNVLLSAETSGSI
jgi:hypothetical protein